MISQIDNILEQIGDLATEQLGDQIVAVYQFGSYGQPSYQAGESDVNLLFLLSDEGDIAALREWFLPLWQRYGTWLRRGPWVASLSAFQRYANLHPDFALGLRQNGRFLHGSPLNLPPLPSQDPHESVAHQATQALAASTAVLPGLLEPQTAEARLLDLRRLARQLWGEPVPEGETAVSTFARVRHILDAKINRLPAARAWRSEIVPAETAPFLPGLQSIYKQGPHIVMVLAHLSPDDARQTEWVQMMDRLAEECQGLVLTTAVQLSLSLVYDNPISLIFKSYQHNWGLNPLANLQTSRRQIMRQAAISAATIGLIDLPRAHLTQDDSQLHTIIHDFQNKLLNLRLQHELLNRFGYLSHFTLPDSLPEREAPAAERLTAIYRQLDWWLDLYTTEMLQAET
jgi:hypothetical protein